MRRQVTVSVWQTRISAEIPKIVLRSCFVRGEMKKDLAAIKKPLHGMVQIILFTKGNRKVPLMEPWKAPPGLLQQYTKNLLTKKR